jgi:tight adherence protein B
MQQLLFPILVAATVALLVWGVAQVVAAGTSRARRRVAERLGGDGGRNARPGQERSSSSSILIHADQTAFARALTRKGFFQRVQRRLAVVWPSVTVSKFVVISASAGFAGAFVSAALFASPLLPPALGIACTCAPFMFLASRFDKRNRSLSDLVPDAMDFLARILRAGHSLTTGLQMMGAELPEPLAGEFRKCYDQHSLGQPLDECLKDLAERVELTEFSFFVTAVLIQRQSGGDLSMVLGNISQTIRSRMRLAGFLRAKTAEGRLTGYILVGFPVFMFLLASSLNPDYGAKLLHTPTGHKLIAAAAVLQITGLFAIRKLTQVRI